MKEFADKPPALIEMAKLLPRPGGVFPLRRQLAWLRAFHVAASFAYGFDPDDIEILIEPDPDWGRDKIVIRPNLKRVGFRPNDQGGTDRPARYPGGGRNNDTSSGIEAVGMNSTIPLITAEMVSAGLKAYRDFLGDDCPIISDEKDLVKEIYCAMVDARPEKENV